MRSSLKVVTAMLAGLVMAAVLLPGTANARNCGIYKEKTGARVDHYQVTRTGRVSCRKAMKLTRQIRSGAHGWKYVSRDDTVRKGQWICGEGAGGGWCRNKRTGAVAGWGLTLHSATLRSGCGRFKRAGMYFAISKYGNVPCRKARRIIESFFFNRGAWKLHGDGTVANSYYTRHKYAGWRCATASGAGGCTYRGGERRISYVTQARSLDPLQASITPRALTTRMKKCGKVTNHQGERPVVSAEHISCGKARRIMKYWYRNGRGVHYHPNTTGGSWTLDRYPGWRCSTGASVGGCTKGKKDAGYSYFL